MAGSRISFHEACNSMVQGFRPLSFRGGVNRRIDHLRYIVDFRSAIWLPYDHRSVANTDARSAPNKQGRACVFSVWRPVRTASALSGSLIRCSAPKMEDDIVRSAHRR